jgi:hypothetical protein
VQSGRVSGYDDKTSFEEERLMLKLVTILVACVLTVLTLRKIMQLTASAAKVRVARPTQPRAVRRLRQDPDTGVYYPEG